MNIDNVLQSNFTDISKLYHKFAIEKDQCRACSIYSAYKQVGQSEGNANNPTFVFIGEALGADEVAQVRPFIGRAGQRLRSEMRKYPDTFNKKSCLITNVLPCRPQDNKFPQGQAKEYGLLLAATVRASVHSCSGTEVVKHCVDKWLIRELEILHPRVIVTIGGHALTYIRGEQGITHNRGSWKFLPQFKAWSFATYHPSYVLRCENFGDKDYVIKQFEEDIKKISTSWVGITRGDNRMAMSNREWDKEQRLDYMIKNRIVKDTPIDEPGE